MVTLALFIVWCVALGLAHRWNPGSLHMPISMFRDTGNPEVGYMLFAVLIATVASHAWTCWNRQERWACNVSLFVSGGLALVAATPSSDRLHNILALTVIVFGYLYFTVSLYREFLEWNDPFMRSIHWRGGVDIDIPKQDRRIARLWQWAIWLHQVVLLIGLIVITAVFRSGGLFQKFVVTHLLLLLVILERLPRRRALRSRRSRRQPVE